jgi:autophagy-related protein 9
MWEKLSNSSLIFSRNFLKTNNDFYNGTAFIHQLYNYYASKGYYNLISNQFINIIVSNFIVFFILFFFNCVDLHSIITLDSNQNIQDFINMSNFFNINYFIWILLIFFYIISFMKIISVIDDIYVYKNISKFYKNTLQITDKELDYIEWDTIIQNIKEKTTQDLDIFYINNIICSKDNYFLYILQNNVLQIQSLNKLLEWNLYFCIFFSVYNNNFKINDNIFTEKNKYSNKIRIKMRIISIINLIFMPFILTLVTFYHLFRYGELFYNNPKTIVSRGYSMREKWRLRHYNELQHEYDERIIIIEKYLSEYISLFKNKIVVIVFRLLIFLLSSILLVLVFLSIINDSILVNLIIFPNKPVLWVIGILAPLIAIFRNYMIYEKKRAPEEVLDDLAKYTFLDEDIIYNAHRTWVYKKISKNFTFKGLLFLKDIISITLTPFNLWKISYFSEDILEELLQITSPHNRLGFICNNSNFEDYMNNSIENNSLEDHSINNFCKKYPNWQPNKSNSIKINVI